MRTDRKPELLCPAGSSEVFKTAVIYGADAVYIGGEAFSLRAKAKNFSIEEMAECIAFAHERKVRVYVTANILAHNADLKEAKGYFETLKSLGDNRPDALIISDPAIFSIAKKVCPEIEIHVSTQANNVNYGTFNFWHELGAKRVVAGRELSLKEISEIRANIPDDLEIEAFVHGAMCISYSGRCLLSNFLTGRDANHGECTHPCRWKYTFSQTSPDDKAVKSQTDTDDHIDEISGTVTEETRPGELFPVLENDRGTFIFNSKDLCMVGHIPDLVAAGIDSFKIEGRMKTALYIATITKAYRQAIDDYFEDPALYEKNIPLYEKMVRGCTYRQYSTGFFYNKPSEAGQIYDSSTYEKGREYLGTVREVDYISDEPLTTEETKSVSIDIMDETDQAFTDAGMKVKKADMCRVLITQKNKFCVGDEIEILKVKGKDERVKVIKIETTDGIEQDSAPHASQDLWITLDKPAGEYDILCR